MAEKPKIFVGKADETTDFIFDEGTFVENKIAGKYLEEDLAPPVFAGEAMLNGEMCTVLGNFAKRPNPRFHVVFNGIMGMEECYKFCQAIYATMDADKDKPMEKKRPIILLIDTPGNSPGKSEEIVGMTKATASYQFALEDARHAGHPVIGMIVGRAISGAFLCHGLLSDRILSLPKEYGTIIHVMPTTSIAVITKIPLERLNELVKTNPVFASGAEFVFKLGTLNEIVDTPDDIRDALLRNVSEIRDLKKAGKWDELGIWARGKIGAERGGRVNRVEAIEKMDKEFKEMLPDLLE